jgi:hypothetical protein
MPAPSPRLVLSIAGVLLVLAVGAGMMMAFIRRPSDETLCESFAALKNAGDEELAAQLLSPKPPLPEQPISPAEAERLSAEYLLHQPLKVLAVEALSGTGNAGSQFVLLVDGSVASERLMVQTPTGVEAQQKTLYNPDIIVEVRDGKLVGVRTTLRGVH